MSPGEGDDVRALAERAFAYHREGNEAAALPLYEQLIRIQPDSAPIRFLMAQAKGALGDTAGEVEALEHAIGLDPTNAGPFVRLAAVVERSGDAERALQLCERGLALSPAHAEARVLRLRLWGALGRFEDVEAELLATGGFHERDLARYWVSEGIGSVERGRPHEAESRFRRAVARDPNSAEAHHRLAMLMHAAHRAPEALEAYARALALAPDHPQALSNYGVLLGRLGRIEEAVRSIGRALEVAPGLAAAENNLGSLLISTGDFDDGLRHLIRATELGPGNMSYASSRLLASLYHPDLPAVDVAEAHFAWGRAQASLSEDAASFPNSRDPERALRVGYVSPDFCAHAVGYALLPVIQAHDPRAVEVVLYGEVPRIDAVTERFKSAVSEWRSTVGVTDAEMVKQIRSDKIDILVDLAGHTDGNRLGIFALRAAPIQINWHGYPCTTGLGSMDYRLVDEITDPTGVADALASERLIRLPGGFVGGAPHAALPPTGIPPVFSNGHVTFGSFNNFAKVNRRVVALWARILRAVPDSRLLMKSSYGADESVHARYRKAFEAEDVSPERLVFRSRTSGLAEHLALYGQMDIALDTFPYNGTATTMEALWMGVPVVALLGEGHAARVSASLLSGIGHDEWVAGDEDAYVAKAVALSKDRNKLAAIRISLRADYMRSTLADPRRLAAAVESAYRTAWRKWCAS